MDMRDISITSFDVRYVTNMLSIFRVSGLDHLHLVP